MEINLLYDFYKYKFIYSTNIIKQPPYSPDMASADFFLSR